MVRRECEGSPSVQRRKVVVVVDVIANVWSYVVTNCNCTGNVMSLSMTVTASNYVKSVIPIYRDCE